ncbi:MAG: arsenite methyltransferase [Chloroflexi bacterium]|uniref:Arsenite methyltransferase n=1 Tax=Candidatus Chlorohelix allophototropha TaxID=3003348 RepID=A0A8T7M9N5_9CHLR|nr:arsenite methyltransferase [Chloroflexota bacterium]
MTTQDNKAITEAVRSRYSSIALTVLDTQSSSSCCDSSCCSDTGSVNTISDRIYEIDQLDGLPLKSKLASLGCGNPTALAELKAGETVLDLGSGGGIDVLLSARRGGATGFVYGLDMTDAMLELAHQNAAEAGAQNVKFLKGDIAAIPLPDNTVDVIISNCVVNLAADKQPVLREAFRVLKPGGRFAISDIVIHKGLPEWLVDDTAFRRDLSSWAGCIAGALTDTEYLKYLATAGFVEANLEVTRRYSLADLGTPLPEWVASLGDELSNDLVNRFASTFVRATKPL